MKILTKKKENEMEAMMWRKLCFVAHVVYERFGEQGHGGSMKDVNAHLKIICQDIMLVDDVINPL